MTLIGYARVSTEDQSLASQQAALQAVGCKEVFEEYASGGMRERPGLASALMRIGRGDTLVVTRIDRLGRSLAHLLEIVEGLQNRGAHFRSLSDPIDTSGPGGLLVLQMLGAVAQFQRSLIRERTRSGLAAARAAGRVGGNPGLRRRDPIVLGKLAASRRARRVAAVKRRCEEWLAIVSKLRSEGRRWSEVVADVNGALTPRQRRFTKAGLVNCVRLLVAEGLASKKLLTAAPRRRNWRGLGARRRAVEMAAVIVGGRPNMTLAEIASELLRFRVLPPRGGHCSMRDGPLDC
jgi:DNA invertase Pin-like site-specific DNA recombinase